MKITFTTVDGKTINASDKNVLAQYATKGKITPNTVIVVDGMSYYADDIPGLFVSPAGNSAPSLLTIIGDVCLKLLGSAFVFLIMLPVIGGEMCSGIFGIDQDTATAACFVLGLVMFVVGLIVGLIGLAVERIKR